MKGGREGTRGDLTGMKEETVEGVRGEKAGMKGQVEGVRGESKNER